MRSISVIYSDDKLFQLFLNSDYSVVSDDLKAFSHLYENGIVQTSFAMPKLTVFQIDEVVNVGASYDQKLKNPNCPGMLKLSLSIGNKKVMYSFTSISMTFMLIIIEQFIGLEMEKIVFLHTALPPGVKVSL